MRSNDEGDAEMARSALRVAPLSLGSASDAGAWSKPYATGKDLTTELRGGFDLR